MDPSNLIGLQDYKTTGPGLNSSYFNHSFFGKYKRIIQKH